MGKRNAKQRLQWGGKDNEEKRCCLNPLDSPSQGAEVGVGGVKLVEKGGNDEDLVE